jgi:SAM-dependent methyltransferase
MNDVLQSATTVTRRCASSPTKLCEFVSLGEFIDRSGLFAHVSVSRCRHCGVGVSFPRIADVAALYADRSSQDFQPGTSGLARRIKEIAFRQQASAMLAQLPERPRRIIDFGCGSGLFTRCLADVAPDIEVIGADFHREAPAELADRAYRCSDCLDDLEGKADLVIALHVLEHDDDAGALLWRIARLARPGGRVLFEVPNIDCVWTKVFGRFWDAWYLPYHRTHFSRASLRALMADSGLEIEMDGDASVPTMGRSVANLLRRRNSLFFILVGAALQPIQLIGEKMFAQPSALRMIVRRPRKRADEETPDKKALAIA